MEPARRAVRDMLASFRFQSGLISVRDRYGDHGLTGFYTVDTVTNRLVHFCFSCRTQNMGVERWMYERLGRPALKVEGEVTTDIFAADMPDWITLARDGDGDASEAAQQSLGRVLVRGGCDLQVMAHYLGMSASSVCGEYHFHRFGKAIRVDHSACVRLALDGISDTAMRALEPIAYRRDDFETALARNEAFDTYLFSFQSDGVQSLYRHRSLGISVPFGVAKMRNSLDLAKVPRARLDARLPDPNARQALDALLENYVHTGLIGEAAFKENLQRMLDATSPGAKVFIILGNENARDAQGEMQVHEHQRSINRWIGEVAANARQDVRPLAIAEHIRDPSEMMDVNHFAPKVYYRLSEALVACARA
jgi:hypothetical protein